MVGKKEGKMSYSVAVTSAGQMTIPKALREMLGIGDHVLVDREDDKIIVRREQTAEEILDELHALFTPEERRQMKEDYGGRLAKDILNEYYQTEEYQKRMKEEYGV